MISAFREVRGFTLVELLVVITITMLGTALVGGLAVDSFKKYRSKAEIMQLQQLVKSAGHLAFVREQNVLITLKEDALTMDWGESKKQTWQFQYIAFPAASLHINSLGIQSFSQVNVITPTGNRSVVFGDQ